MPRWQRWATYWLLLTCMFSGLVWFVLADLFMFTPPGLRVWWISHGVTAMPCMLMIGAAMPQHINVTWRAHRNRRAGSLITLLLATLIASALALLYGSEAGHDAGRLIHSYVGMAVLVLFPWHIWHGRRSVARIDSLLRHGPAQPPCNLNRAP